MKSFDAFALVGAMAGLLSGQPALAETASQIAELKQLHIELVDLDPSDGIAPSIQIHDGYFISVNGILSPANWPDGFISDRLPVGVAFSRETSSSLLPSASLRLEASGGDVLGSVGPTLSAFGDASPDGFMWGRTAFEGVFTLSPHTRVVLSGQPGDIQVNLAPGTPMAVWASASVGFCPLTPSGGAFCYDETTQTNHSDVVAASEYKDGWNTGSMRPSFLSITWDNAESSEQTHYLFADAIVLSAHLSSAPVPEPSIALMLAMGLGVAGWATRQRRRPTPFVCPPAEVELPVP